MALVETEIEGLRKKCKSNNKTRLKSCHIYKATFRMASGHDDLQSCLYRIGLVDSPLRQEEDRTEDLLNICRALATHITDRITRVDAASNC